MFLHCSIGAQIHGFEVKDWQSGELYKGVELAHNGYVIIDATTVEYIIYFILFILIYIKYTNLLNSNCLRACPFLDGSKTIDCDLPIANNLSICSQ